MPAIQVFDFDPARLEGDFSDMQPAAEPVQRVESAVPGCCGRTRVSISCREASRGYVLQLPLKGRLPNESPQNPPSNHFSHVMAAQIPPPVLQVLSGHRGGGVAEITIMADGPRECPPGVESRLRLEGVGGGIREVPQTAWVWLAPAILDADLLEEMDEALISLFHPFKMPELPAQTWVLDLPRCVLSRMSARVATFPDVRWTGRLNVSTKPSTELSAGHELIISGDLACSYDGRHWPVKDKQQAKALCKWFEGVEVFARSAASIMSLRPGARHAGLDNPRLVRMEPLRFEPWPNLSMHLDAALFEQEGNGLLGHSLQMQIQGSPMIGASGEMSLIGPWLEQQDKKPFIRPLLAGLDVIRTEEIAQELGIWLVADGQISLHAAVKARRPQAQTVSKVSSQGAITIGMEVRSRREYDGFIIHQAGADNPGERAGFTAVCAPPDETPQTDPREHKPKAAFQFTGLQFYQIEKRRPGCIFRHMPPGSAETRPDEAGRGCLLAPSRAWPADSKIEAPAEIPWCS